MSQNNDLDLSSTKKAFDSFFSKDALKSENSPSTNQGKNVDLNPVDRVMQQVEAQKKPPNSGKQIHKINADSDSNDIESMSVEDAKSILNQRKTFDEMLKDFDVKYSDLFSIIDAFLERGTYEKKYSIKNFHFVLRAKKVHSIDTINDDLDGAKFTLPSAAEQLILERNLAASLCYFKLGESPARIFNHDSEEDDRAVLEFIRKEVSSPIYRIMCSKLAKFEVLVTLATREEALDHFLEHTQD